MSENHLTNEVWILGATGRVGRAVAAHLVQGNTVPVLLGRDAERLNQLAASLEKRPRIVVAASPEAIVTEISQQRPAVVINTIGPFFTETTARIARACLPYSHYIDLANDTISLLALLSLHDVAVAAGRTLVTGVGFGVLATESVVLKLCKDRPTPDQGRTNMVPSIETEAGVIGEALAGTLIDGLPYGGRCYKKGRLVRNQLGGSPAPLTLPDGSSVTTASIPLGELIAAQRASGAPNVLAATSELPTGIAVQVMMPFAIAMFRFQPLRAFAKRRLARVKFTSRERPRVHSWGHAAVQWPDGTEQQGWMRTEDAMTFTVAVVAKVAEQLMQGNGRPGTYTPGALFGPELAEAAGGTLILGDLLIKNQ